MNGEPKVVLVDDNDQVIDALPYVEAVASGQNRRIIRTFVINDAGQFLLQQRSNKYFMPLLWDQAAGGHVDEGETYLEAAVRETNEEIGAALRPEDFQEIMYYFAQYSGVSKEPNAQPSRLWNKTYLVRHEGPFRPDKNEVEQVAWVDVVELEAWMHQKPHEFTDGFRDAYTRYKELKL